MAEENDGFAPYRGDYCSLHSFNRFTNVDGIEWKIISHLLQSKTKYAKDFWKILGDNHIDSLSRPGPSTFNDRLNLVWTAIGEKDENGQPITDKRLFLQPFVDDAWSKQCSSVYVYVDKVKPIDATRANIVVVVEVVVHSKISVIKSGVDPKISDEIDETVSRARGKINPNDRNKQGDIVVPYKNRATVLLKSILAELNGLYLDGIGTLQVNQIQDSATGADLSLWNNRSFYGYSIRFTMLMSNASENPECGC